MKKFLALALLIGALPANAAHYLTRPYGVSTTIDFELFEIDGVNKKTDAAYASGDVKIMKDEGSPTDATNGFTDEGTDYALVLTAAEMQAARVVITVVDQSTKVWLDETIVIETYGTSTSQHPDPSGRSVFAGTADSGTTATLVDAALTQSDTDYWAKDIAVVFTSGSIAGQVACVSKFTPGTDTITFTPPATAAVSTNTYVLIPAPGCDPFR